MQKGIGRTGYFLLALIVFAMGSFGFVLAWSAFEATATGFFLMGLGVAGAALIILWAFASFAPFGNEAEAVMPAPVQAAREPAPPVKPPAMNFEFTDYEPAATAAPDKLVLPPAFETPDAPGMVSFQEVAPPRQAAPRASAAEPSRDRANWPGQQGTSSWTHQQQHRNKVRSEVEDASRRHELTDRYTRTTPTLRAILDDVPPPMPAPMAESTSQMTMQVPSHVADRAPGGMNTDFVAPGMSVGRCGQCQTVLLAPEVRPLRLKCPECAKVTLLE